MTRASSDRCGDSVAVILNPIAGPRRSRLTPDAARNALARHGLEGEILPTTGPGEAVALARAAAARHPVVAAAGGDGTVHEVATGLLGTDAALAVLPGGSGNDYALGLGIGSLRAGLDAVAGGVRRAVDVVCCGERRFFNSAGFFLSGLVSLKADRLSRRLGRWRYRLASVAALATYRPPVARWILDHGREVVEGPCLLAEAGNGPCAGGGFVLCPGADPGDGWLDLCFVRPLSLWALLRVFPAAARGEHVDHEAVYRTRARTAVLEVSDRVPLHLDGEATVMEAGRYELWLEPGRLMVCAPAPAGRPGAASGGEDR
jgi:diacylglycerol kinase (ATP)